MSKIGGFKISGAEIDEMAARSIERRIRDSVFASYSKEAFVDVTPWSEMSKRVIAPESFPVWTAYYESYRSFDMTWMLQIATELAGRKNVKVFTSMSGGLINKVSIGLTTRLGDVVFESSDVKTLVISGMGMDPIILSYKDEMQKVAAYRELIGALLHTDDPKRLLSNFIQIEEE